MDSKASNNTAEVEMEIKEEGNEEVKESKIKEYENNNNDDNPSSSTPSIEGANPGKIFVGGLPKDITDGDFIKHFKKYGKIVDSVIIKQPYTRIPRGFGFITYKDPAVVDAVMHETHILRGKQVEIKKAELKKPGNSNPRPAFGRGRGFKDDYGGIRYGSYRYGGGYGGDGSTGVGSYQGNERYGSTGVESYRSEPSSGFPTESYGWYGGGGGGYDSGFSAGGSGSGAGCDSSSSGGHYSIGGGYGSSGAGLYGGRGDYGGHGGYEGGCGGRYHPYSS